MNITKALALFLLVSLCPTTSHSSPIDDASSYAVRIKATVRYAFAEETEHFCMIPQILNSAGQTF